MAGDVSRHLDLDAEVGRRVLAALRCPCFAAAVAVRSGLDPEAVGPRLGDIASEAELALGLLQSIAPIPADARILEVGAGPGVVSGLLAALGADITAIEPEQEGFELFGSVHAELAQTHADVGVELQRRVAAELSPEADGTFDLIFSINVLEHLQPRDDSLDALAKVLAPGGLMLHTCPNYRIPYEPHYAMPLVPGRPAWTARLRRRLRDEPLWQSLNFITARHLADLAERWDLQLHLRPGVLRDSLERLGSDPDFARRQGLVGRVAAVAARPRILRWLGRVPASWMTPMVAEIRRPMAVPTD